MLNQAIMSRAQAGDGVFFNQGETAVQVPAHDFHQVKIGKAQAVEAIVTRPDADICMRCGYMCMLRRRARWCGVVLGRWRQTLFRQ